MALSAAVFATAAGREALEALVAKVRRWDYWLCCSMGAANWTGPKNEPGVFPDEELGRVGLAPRPVYRNRSMCLAETMRAIFPGC